MQQVTAAKKTAVELEKDYKMYRVNFVAWWIVLNALWMLALTLINSIHYKDMNDGTIRVIDVTGMFLSGIVVYKVFFGSLHIIWFKIRVTCNPKFKIQNFNMRKEVKRLKKGGNVNDSEQGSLLSMEEEFLKEED